MKSVFIYLAIFIRLKARDVIARAVGSGERCSNEILEPCKGDLDLPAVYDPNLRKLQAWRFVNEMSGP